MRAGQRGKWREYRQSPGQSLPGELLLKRQLAKVTEKMSHRQRRTRRGLHVCVWMGINGWKKKKGAEERNKDRSKVLEKWEERSACKWRLGLPQEQRNRLCDPQDWGQTACTEAAAGQSRGKMRAQLESLALNPLVYLLGNPYGKPIYKSQQVFREDQKFSLALWEGVCIAELISEPRLTLGKKGGKECFIFRNPPSPTSFTISPTSSFLIWILC